MSGAGEGCSKGAKKWWDTTVSKLRTHTRIFFDPLSAIAELRAALKDDPKASSRFGICRPCRHRIIQVLSDSREYLWLELDYFFAVEPRKNQEMYGYDFFT